MRARDAAGNLDPSAPTYSWTVVSAADTTPPETTIDAGPDASTDSTNATFAFSSSESGTFECALDGGEFAACESPHDYTSLAVAGHSFAVRAIDAAGNVDPTPAVYGWTVVEPPPVCGPTLTLVADGDASVLQANAAANTGADLGLGVTAQASANVRSLVHFPLPAAADLPAGCVVSSAVLRLHATVTAAERKLQVRRVDGAWTENAVTWENQPATPGAAVTVDSATGDLEWNVTTLVQAEYRAGTSNGFLVRDAADGGAPAVQSFASSESAEHQPVLILQLDQIALPETTPPETTIAGQPDTPTTATEATFSFLGTDNATPDPLLAYECRIDGGNYAACSIAETYTGLADGQHSFDVRAVDRAGNVDPTPATFAWVIDTTAAADDDRLRAGRHDLRDQRDARILGQRAGRDLRVLARRSGLRRLRLAGRRTPG